MSLTTAAERDPRAPQPRRHPIKVALARDPWRIIAWLGVRLAVGELAVIVGLATPGAIGFAVTVAGAVVLGYVTLLGLHVLSLRLEVTHDEIRVASALLARRYLLEEAPVARLSVPARKGVFHTQLGGFGIEIGHGRAPDGRTVDVVRLAPVASMLLVPASPRPVAVAPLAERSLLRALRSIGSNVTLDTRHGALQPAASEVSR